MPHFPKPFFRADRALWYVQIDGRQHNLGPDRELAFQRYHELMTQPPERRVASEEVAVLIDAFLEWCQKHRKERTYLWYKDYAQQFVEFIPRGLTVARLKPFHLQRWIDGRETWNSGNKRNGCRAIIRAMKWAEQQGYIERSPLAHFQKPPAGRRERVISQAEYDALLRAIRDPNFRDLVVLMWETGARPQESLKVESRHVDLINGRWVFPQAEAKMGKQPRVVYLTEKALTITRRMMLKHPHGPLFRNRRNKPYTAGVVRNRLRLLANKTGFYCCPYNFRHTWATRALQNGVDPLTVSVLMGHSDTGTLARTYAHLAQDPAYLRAAVVKAQATNPQSPLHIAPESA